MHDPNLNYYLADVNRANERYRERLSEAEARRLENLALGQHRARPLPVRLAVRLLQVLPALLRAVLNPLRVHLRRVLGAEQAAHEP